MEGMMATSTAPVRSASAHSDGTVKESSQRPAKGPLVKPQTSGAVFRYSTMEMRSLLTFLALFDIGLLSHMECARRHAARSFGEMRCDEKEWGFLEFFQVMGNADLSQKGSDPIPC